MEKQLLISLVSDQTIPNVQIIKEFGNSKTDYKFLLTKGMQRKGIVQWIVDATQIKAFQDIFVDEYSVADIENELQKIDYSEYSRIIVNLTGGTKMMVLSVFDFFRNKQNTEMYYVIGIGNAYQKIVDRGCEQKVFSCSISLEEYLKSYGFSIKKAQPSGISFEQTEKIYSHYINGDFLRYPDSLNFLRERRGKVITGTDFINVKDFLEAIEYYPAQEGILSKLETKYLTGEWFEEYIGAKIKCDLELTDNQILVGTTIRKDVPLRQELNSVSTLLGLEDKDMGPDNEIDIMFVKDNRFYVIECKTSIIAGQRTISKPRRNKKGEFMYDEKGQQLMDNTIKEENILGETIYKSDALRTKFGLFAKSYIFTLSNLKQWVANDSNKAKNISDLLKRASLSNIKIVDRALLIQAENMRNLL